jgi:hypothetical protein
MCLQLQLYALPYLHIPPPSPFARNYQKRFAQTVIRLKGILDKLQN